MATTRTPRLDHLLTCVEDEGGDYKLVFLEPAEDFDDAIVGVVTGFGQEPAVLYNRDMVLEVFVRQGMTIEDAEEYFSFNTEGAYVGPHTPRFLTMRVPDPPPSRG
jgi:hypothetical protein